MLAAPHPSDVNRSPQVPPFVGHIFIFQVTELEIPQFWCYLVILAGTGTALCHQGYNNSNRWQRV